MFRSLKGFNCISHFLEFSHCNKDKQRMEVPLRQSAQGDTADAPIAVPFVDCKAYTIATLTRCKVLQHTEKAYQANPLRTWLLCFLFLSALRVECLVVFCHDRRKVPDTGSFFHVKPVMVPDGLSVALSLVGYSSILVRSIVRVPLCLTAAHFRGGSSSRGEDAIQSAEVFEQEERRATKKILSICEVRR